MCNSMKSIYVVCVCSDDASHIETRQLWREEEGRWERTLSSTRKRSLLLLHNCSRLFFSSKGSFTHTYPNGKRLNVSFVPPKIDLVHNLNRLCLVMRINFSKLQIMSNWLTCNIRQYPTISDSWPFPLDIDRGSTSHKIANELKRCMDAETVIQLTKSELVELQHNTFWILLPFRGMWSWYMTQRKLKKKTVLSWVFSYANNGDFGG